MAAFGLEPSRRHAKAGACRAGCDSAKLKPALKIVRATVGLHRSVAMGGC